MQLFVLRGGRNKASTAHRGGGVPSVKSYVTVCSNPLVHGGRRESQLTLAPTGPHPHRPAGRTKIVLPSPRLSPIHHPKPMSFQRRAGGRNDMQPPAVRGVVLPMVWKCVVMDVRIEAWHREIATGINIGLGAGSCAGFVLVLSGTNGATPALMGKSWLVIGAEGG